jgi:hypothetical protein
MGFRFGFAKTRFEKALACFCSLYSHDPHRERLIRLLWCCAGLEGFYTDNAGGAAAQLRRRIPLVLTDIVDIDSLKKKISNIYRVRSSTLHGERGLFAPIGDEYADKESVQRQEDEAEIAAFTLLVDTLRASVRGDLNDPLFVEQLHNG